MAFDIVLRSGSSFGVALADSAISILPDDLFVGSTIDAGTLTQNHVISVDDLAVGSTIDQPALTQNHLTTPEDLFVGSTIDEPTFAVFVNILPNDLAVESTIDSPSLTQNHVTDPVDLVVENTIDSPPVIQNHLFTIDELYVQSSIDEGSLSQNHSVQPNDLAVDSALDEPSLSQNHSIQPSDLFVESSIDSPDVEVFTEIMIYSDDIAVESSIDSPNISHNYSISADDLDILTSIDSPKLSLFYLKSANMVHKFKTGDTVTIKIYDLDTDELVVDDVADEIAGIGYFKFYHQDYVDPLREYLYIMSNGKIEQSGRLSFKTGDLVGEIVAIVTEEDRIRQLHTIRGLNPSYPRYITPTEESADDITLAITGDGITSQTVTRQ